MNKWIVFTSLQTSSYPGLKFKHSTLSYKCPSKKISGIKCRHKKGFSCSLYSVNSLNQQYAGFLRTLYPQRNAFIFSEFKETDFFSSYFSRLICTRPSQVFSNFFPKVWPVNFSIWSKSYRIIDIIPLTSKTNTCMFFKISAMFYRFIFTKWNEHMLHQDPYLEDTMFFLRCC